MSGRNLRFDQAEVKKEADRAEPGCTVGGETHVRKGTFRGRIQLDDPKGFESTVNQIAGVVTVGLFAARRADVLIIAGEAGVRTVDCSRATPQPVS